MTRNVQSRVTSFRGLNDRRLLPGLANGEFADARNVELSRRCAEKRLGFQRLGGPLLNGSLRLDGRNDYLRIPTQSAYRITDGTAGIFFGIGVVLRSHPASAVTVVSAGFGAVGNLFFDLRYDPTAGTGSLGAWVARVRDASGGGSTVTVTLDDGSALGAPVGKFRYLELIANADSVTLDYHDHVGTSPTFASGTGITTLNPSSGQDFFIGVGTTAANVVGTDYIDATLCEARYGTYPSGIMNVGHFQVDTSNHFHRRELTPEAIGAGYLLGYWKLNDGGLDSRLADSSTAGNNPALIVNNPAHWVLKSENPLVIGASALQFTGGASWMDLQDIVGTVTAASPLSRFMMTFSAASPNVARWTVRTVLILPSLPTGASAWPDGVIFWSGTNTTTPHPVGLRIVSDRFEGKYDDNGTVRTVTLNAVGDPTVSSLAGKRMVLALSRSGSGTGNFEIWLTVDNGDGTVTTYMATIACTGAVPATVSGDWAFGRHVTNFGTARLGTSAFHTDGALVGIVDQFQLIHTNSLTAPRVGTGASLGVTNAAFVFNETFQWNQGQGQHTLHLTIRFNDGAGNNVMCIGSLATDSFGGGFRARVRPEIDDGARWDHGYVEPYRPVRASLIYPYDRFLADGTKARSLLVAAGTTLHRYTEDDGLEVVGSLPGAADAYTAAQYDDEIVLAGPKGRRPSIYDGGSLRRCGIRAPDATAIVALTNGAGTFTAGQHYLYVTYRSTLGRKVRESNPSPGVLVTFAGADDTIDSLQLPVSSDPQVTQRRVWMTASAVAAVDGETAYLVATIDDNTTVNYTTDINGPVSTSAETLEYFEHEEAPVGTVVEQFNDYTLLGGSQLYPTRLYFSEVGVPDYWNAAIDGRYLDLDLDSGDPIIRISSLLDRAVVDVGDGKWAIHATGDPDAPLGKSKLNDTHGAVGALASVVVNNQQWYIGETDLYVSDGYRETNVSNPDELPTTAPVYVQQLGRTSIHEALRTKMDWSGRTRFCVSEYRGRSQIWFGVRLTDGPSWLTGTNTHVWVYDVIQGFWSRYDLPVDVMCQAELDDEQSELVGVVQGYVVRFDQSGYGDGIAESESGIYTVLTATAVSSSSNGTTVTFGGTPFTGSEYDGFKPLRHLRAWVYHKSDHTVTEHRIARVAANNQLRFESADATMMIGDLVSVGTMPYWFDVAVGFGDPLSTKALLGVACGADLVSSAGTLRVQHKGDVRTVPATLSGFASRYLTLAATTMNRWLGLGGLGVTFYVRFSETGYAAGTSVAVFPGTGSFRFHGLAFEGNEKASRSRS